MSAICLIVRVAGLVLVLVGWGVMGSVLAFIAGCFLMLAGVLCDPEFPSVVQP